MESSERLKSVGTGTYSVVFNEGIDAPQACLERWKDIGRLHRDVQKHLRPIDKPLFLRYAKM